MTWKGLTVQEEGISLENLCPGWNVKCRGIHSNILHFCFCTMCTHHSHNHLIVSRVVVYFSGVLASLVISNHHASFHNLAAFLNRERKNIGEKHKDRANEIERETFKMQNDRWLLGAHLGPRRAALGGQLN